LGKYQQNAGRVDHVIFIVYLDHIEAAVRAFSELLDLEMDGPYDTQGGVRTYIDWAAGIEIVAPVDAAVAVAQTAHLAKHGEGIYRIVFGVASRAKALERAAGLGYEVSRLIDGFLVNDGWRGDFERIDEASLSTPVFGAGITFGEIVPKGAGSPA
jgi:4-hydroxyphenylpyruvate dioxygenase-like putative hemolysin